MSFYGIAPFLPNWLSWLPLVNVPLLEKAIAKKVGLENVPGFGLLQKVEVKSSRMILFGKILAEGWFDPNTGKLIKFNIPMASRSGILHRNDPLLQLAHP